MEIEPRTPFGFAPHGGSPEIAAGFSAITLGRIGPFDLGGSRRTPGSTSTVRSTFLDMELDHDTGAMSGRVTGGSFAGRRLDDLGEDDLRLLYREVAIDPESLSLLEAYLDRRFPAWREDADGDAHARGRNEAAAGAMTEEEAREVLGLQPGAGEADIRRAHRTLMKKLHPDQGGSTYLAARVNQAKDILLSRHR